MEQEIANVAEACGLSGFRYLCFPPPQFPTRLALVSPRAEPGLAVAPPAADQRPELRFQLISELISTIEIQPAPPLATSATNVSRAAIARPAKPMSRRAARPASPLVPKR